MSFVLFLPNMLGITYAKGRFYSIQLGASKSLKNAEDMVNNLKRLGHNAFYRYETVKGKGKWYRVYIERFVSKKEAEKEAKILRELELISDYSIKTIDETTQTGSRERKHDINVYYLHISSFKEKANAGNLVQRLKKHGHRAFYVAEESWFKVYIGEFGDEREAQKAGTELRENGIISYFRTLLINKSTLFSNDTKSGDN